MKDRDVKLSVTLEQLKLLLNQQKEIVCETLSTANRNGKLLNDANVVDNAFIKNIGKSAAFPNDINVLSQYFNNG